MVKEGVGELDCQGCDAMASVASAVFEWMSKLPCVWRRLSPTCVTGSDFEFGSMELACFSFELCRFVTDGT